MGDRTNSWSAQMCTYTTRSVAKDAVRPAATELSEEMQNCHLSIAAPAVVGVFLPLQPLKSASYLRLSFFNKLNI